MFDVPFGYAYRDFSRLELDAYRDEHFMFGTVYNRIVGKEPGEVDFGQRFPVRLRRSAGLLPQLIGLKILKYVKDSCDFQTSIWNKIPR